MMRFVRRAVLLENRDFHVIDRVQLILQLDSSLTRLQVFHPRRLGRLHLFGKTST